MIGQTISHYKILEELGAGGMGVVYKAEDTKLKRTVALKFLPPELTRDKDAKTRFVHEAQAASALQHHNICAIHEIDETPEGQLFISMDCYEGKTLRERIAEGPLAVDETIDVVAQIAEGLAKAHESGMVHRDIKPANIMVTNDGMVKILDFGLAKLAGMTKVTKTGKTVGTLSYMSPEQASGDDVDHRTDIWALGIVLYEMLTGQVPFKSDYEQAVVYSILNEAPEPITALRTGVPVEVEKVVGKALEKEQGSRYQRIEELLADLGSLRDKGAAGAATRLPSARGRRVKRILIPVFALLVVAVALVLGDRIQIGPQPSAVAEENSLAVMQFDNIVDPEDTERIGEIVTNLLITDLSESQYVRVLSTQRLSDIRKQLGMNGEKVIDRDAASLVAGKANVRWMLLGSILQVDPSIVITSQLIDVETGQVEASQRIASETEEGIFSLVDKLTVEIKKDLSLPSRAQEEDTPVADVTTSSQEAYRYYLEGTEYSGKQYFVEAAKSYKKALEIDSTFAMAYYDLFWCGGEETERQEMMDKAVKYSDRVSNKEKWYIKGQAAMISGDNEQAIGILEKIVERHPDEKPAYLWLGENYLYLEQYEMALVQYHKAIELDPLYWNSYRMAAYVYEQLGNNEKALESLNKAIAVAPDEAAPHNHKGHFYARNGMIDNAIESYKKAVAIKSDMYWSRSSLGNMYLYKGDYTNAETCYRELASSTDSEIRPWGRLLLAFIPLHQGKFEQALRVLEDGLAADRMEQAEGYWNEVKYCLRARIQIDRGDFDSISNDIGERGCVSSQVLFLTENKDYAKAEEIARTRGGDYQDAILGSIELEKGDPEAAVVFLEKSVEQTNSTDFDSRYLLAKAYLETGELAGAVSQLEGALSRYGHFHFRSVIWTVKAHYLLGMAFERSGWTNKAIEQYEEFLEIWKDADPGIPEVEDAKQRLAKLKNGD
jgi:serine/threonine protein kinase/Flp pilus assembly protein TadD